jgi:hypothetical protein
MYNSTKYTDGDKKGFSVVQILTMAIPLDYSYSDATKNGSLHIDENGERHD